MDPVHPIPGKGKRLPGMPQEDGGRTAKAEAEIERVVSQEDCAGRDSVLGDARQHALFLAG